VYGKPANLFVAGFIGNPPMNLIPGTLRGGGMSTFTSPDFNLTLPDVPSVAIDGQEVVLGVRPQDIELVLDADAPATARGKVWVVELIGSEKLVEVAFGDRRRVTVQVRAEAAINIDDVVALKLNARRAHLFDAATGRALR
jgi:ABC-type sugar transport system ATPase subunit